MRKKLKSVDGDPTAESAERPIAPSFIDLLAERQTEPGLRKGERTRRRVLWATAAELAATSFAALSMDQIASTADVSRAALYQYVGSKEDAVRMVLTDFHALSLTGLGQTSSNNDVFETILRTNRYYIDYFAKNAVFMERVRELRDALPELIAEKQRVNRAWAARVAGHVNRHRQVPMPAASLRLRVFALECMIDDVLRELFVIGNPDIRASCADLDFLASELSSIWMTLLYDQ